MLGKERKGNERVGVLMGGRGGGGRKSCKLDEKGCEYGPAGS